MTQATFGAGCFWGVEAKFRQLRGVIDTKVGFMGGTTENPTYNDVCKNNTGHVEVVSLEYDPALISFEELVLTFWALHDPTQLNRQGPDVGSQYRSAIFYHDDEQRRLALLLKKDLNESGAYNRPIVTEITKASTFYPAEEYHQRYYDKHDNLFCGGSTDK